MQAPVPEKDLFELSNVLESSSARQQRPFVVAASALDLVAPLALLLIAFGVARASGHFKGDLPLIPLLLSTCAWALAIITTSLHSPSPTLKTPSAFWACLLSFLPVVIFGVSVSSLESWISAFAIPLICSFLYVVIRPLWMRPAFIGRSQNILFVGNSSLSSECRSLASTQLGFKGRPLFHFRQVGPLEPGLANIEIDSVFDRAQTEVEKGLYDQLVLALPDSFPASNRLEELIARARTFGCDVTSDRGFYVSMSGAVPVEFLPRAADSYHFLLQPKRSSRTLSIIRRAIDLAFALPGVLVMTALIPLIWLANLLSGDRGPLFYKQVRVGLGGSLYSIWKFRTMRVDAENGKARWASKDDPRITQVGKFMRLSRVDEIPQFINVLKGEMTLVGPRPERPELVEVIKRDVPFYELRHLVKPGITGWAQVKFRYGASVEDSLTKLRYDLQYVRHNTVLHDLWIILRTPMIMLEKIGY